MHVIIVGAGYAGLSCALRLARKSHGNAKITLINASEQFIERIRLHERAAGAPARALDLRALLRGSGVTLRVGWVQAVDPKAHTITVDDEVLSWDRLVLALGSVVDVDSVEGVREHAYTLDASSAAWLAPTLPAIARRGGRVVVVGGGLTGIEAATEIAERHPTLKVVLATRGELAPGFSRRAREHVRAALERLGVELREHVAVRALRTRELVHDGEPIPFDACIWAAGFSAPPLAKQLALPLNDRGQVLVDAGLRALSHPDVVVAGDLAGLSQVVRDPMPMGCKSALPTGLHAADSVARSLRGEAPRPFAYSAVPFCVSLGRHDAIVELPGRDPERRRVLRGKFAAAVKEFICRGPVWALKLERRRAAPLARLELTPRLPSDARA